MPVVNLSPLGGAAAQFFDSNGNPLSSGFIYTYAAGTNTPQATYTTAAGNIQHSNPIQLDAAGRVPTGEIWLTANQSYKFVTKDANNVLIGTYDNLTGINGTGIASNATNVEYDPPFTGALTSNYSVANKLSQVVSVKDFGAKGDVVTDDTAAIQAAFNNCKGKSIYFPAGTYTISSTIVLTENTAYSFFGAGIGISNVEAATDIAIFQYNPSTNSCYYANVENITIGNRAVTTTGNSIGIHVSNKGVQRGIFKNVHFRGNYFGFKVDSGTSSAWLNLTELFCDNYGGNETAYGIYDETGCLSIICDSIIFATKNCITLAVNYGDFSITGNNFYGGTTGYGIQMSGSPIGYFSNFVIAANKFDGYGLYAVAINYAHYFKVFDNIYSNNANILQFNNCDYYLADSNSGGLTSRGTVIAANVISPNVFVNEKFNVGSQSLNPIADRVNGYFCDGNQIGYRGNTSSAFALGIAGTLGNAFIFYTDNGSTYVGAGSIVLNGSSATYNTSSDYRLKENVLPMQNALDKIMQLNPVTFDWKEGFEGNSKNGQGFIAHELQEIVPDCVTGIKDGEVDIGNLLDTNGNVIQTNVKEPEKLTNGETWQKTGTKPVYQGIDTSFLVATLTKALQELKQEFDAYKTMHP